ADSILNTNARTDGLFDKLNAFQILNAMGPNSNNAATICILFGLNATDDSCKKSISASNWYLPSVVELDSMYENLAKKGVGNFEQAGYWSSVEATTRHNSFGIFNSAYVVDFVRDGSNEDGKSRENDKSNKNRVRAVREFWIKIR